MGAFFLGWRRKTGLLTLMMALLSFSMWCRSHVVVDEFSGGSVLSDTSLDFSTIGTSEGQVEWRRTNERHFGELGLICLGASVGPSWTTRTYEMAKPELADDYEYSARQQLPGIEFSKAVRNHRIDEATFVRTVTLWKASLLWPVVSLTLLSGCLLLSKPRPAKPPPSAEIDPETAA